MKRRDFFAVPVIAVGGAVCCPPEIYEIPAIEIVQRGLSIKDFLLANKGWVWTYDPCSSCGYLSYSPDIHRVQLAGHD